SRALKNEMLWAIAAASFVALFALDAPFPAVIAAAALIGYVGGRLAPKKFTVGGGHGPASKSFGRAIIDDDTPTPAHAIFDRRRLGLIALVGLALWLVPMSVLLSVYGWSHMLTQMSWVFTEGALLSFCGAYSVL